MFIAIYVDDLLIFGKDTSKLQQLQHELKSRFRMTDLGEVSYYLGIEVNVNTEKSIITLRQTTYLKKILQRFNMVDCRPISTPMVPVGGRLAHVASHAYTPRHRLCSRSTESILFEPRPITLANIFSALCAISPVP